MKLPKGVPRPIYFKEFDEITSKYENQFIDMFWEWSKHADKVTRQKINDELEEGSELVNWILRMAYAVVCSPAGLKILQQQGIELDEFFEKKRKEDNF